MAKSPAVADAKACTKCAQVQPLSAFYTTGVLASGAPKRNSWCKRCISAKQAEYHRRTWGPERLQRSAFKRTRTVRAYLTYLRAKAVQRAREDVLSTDALELLWHTQQGRCALTGWEMTLELGRGVVSTNCSIDRIDSRQGYVVGNVQLVCRAANVAKHDLSQQEFIALCRAVLEAQNG